MSTPKLRWWRLLVPSLTALLSCCAGQFAGFAQESAPPGGAPARSDQTDPGAAPGDRGALSPVTLRGGRRSEPLIWTGDAERFSVYVEVEPGSTLQGLELVLTHPRAGEKVERTVLSHLTDEQLRGRAPVEWIVPCRVDGRYLVYFRAQAVGSPEVVRYPTSGFLTFEVRDRLWMILFAVGLTLVWFLLIKFGIFGVLTKGIKNQTRVAPAALGLFALGAFVAWSILLNLLGIWMILGVAAVLFVITSIVALS